MAGQRIEKINDLIRDHLAQIINRKVTLPAGVFASITKVDTSADLRYSKVLISVFPEKERSASLKILTKNLYRIQGLLNKNLHCKPLPKITLISDETEKEMEDLEKVFQQIKEE